MLGVNKETNMKLKRDFERQSRSVKQLKNAVIVS